MYRFSCIDFIQHHACVPMLAPLSATANDQIIGAAYRFTSSSKTIAIHSAAARLNTKTDLINLVVILTSISMSKSA